MPSCCGYCDFPLNVGRDELTREEIQGVFSCLYRDGVRFVLVQGGEPLLRRDFQEILEDLSVIGFHLMLITNGMKVEPKITGSTGSKGRTDRGTVIGKTMSIILRSSTVPIAQTVPEQARPAEPAGPLSFLSVQILQRVDVSGVASSIGRRRCGLAMRWLFRQPGAAGAWVAGGLNFHTEGRDDEEDATRNQWDDVVDDRDGLAQTETSVIDQRQANQDEWIDRGREWMDEKQPAE